MLVSRSDRGLFARWWFTVDRPLLSAVLLLMAVGVLISMAASPPVAERIGLNTFHFFKFQLAFLVPAMVLLISVSLLEPRQARRAAFVMLGLSLGLMVAALFWGPEIKGAHRWINFGPIGLQPSELAKPSFVVIAAWFLSEHTKRPEMPGHVIAYLIFTALVGLLVLQPDFGQTALVVVTFGAMLLIYGIPWVLVLGLAGLCAAGAAAAYALVPHVASRFDRFLNPDKGDTFQVDTATAAFRNGGLLGTGPGGGEAKQILPDAHTDFTFAVVGEEFGLGIVFGLQAVINMGVNVSLLPAKGMTLPLISYGGSSLIGVAFAMGMVLAFSRRQPHVSLSSTAWQPVTA